MLGKVRGPCLGYSAPAIWGIRVLTGFSLFVVSEVVLSGIVIPQHSSCISVISSGNPIFRLSVSCNSLVCRMCVVDSCMSGGVCIRTSSLGTGVSDSGARLAIPVSSYTGVVELM